MWRARRCWLHPRERERLAAVASVEAIVHPLRRRTLCRLSKLYLILRRPLIPRALNRHLSTRLADEYYGVPNKMDALISASFPTLAVSSGYDSSGSAAIRTVLGYVIMGSVPTLQMINRVCFGLTSSPYHALRTVRQLIDDDGAMYPLASRITSTSLYMDDVAFSLPSESEASEASQQLINLFKGAQWDLIKWNSNYQSVLDNLPASHKITKEVGFDKSMQHKILGLHWSTDSDEFYFKISIPDDVTCTKRSILSTVARLWDIMGFVAPTVVVLDNYSLGYPISVYAFLDSKVALYWIRSSPHKWQTFVANRVVQITDNIPADSFYHVAGTENPADILSRGSPSYCPAAALLQ
ncbi:unnamed protein product, partial [Iphiclides podalirius]